MAATVHLGVAGDLVGPTEHRSHVHSVAGGRAVFPGAGPPVHASSTEDGAAAADLATLPPLCPTCSKPTALVLQAHAPLQDAPDRALYVFSCVSDGGEGGGGCAAGEGGWVVLRAGVSGGGGPAVDAPAATPAVAEPAPALAAPAPPAPVFGGGGDGGWSDDDNERGGGGAEEGGATALDLTALSAELAAAGAALAAAQATGTRRPPAKEAAEPEGALAVPSWSLPPSTTAPSLPAFWVGWAPEPAGPPKPSAAEDAHIAELLAAYRAEEGEGEEAVPGDDEEVGGCAVAAPGPSSKKPTGVSWAGEAYEQDAAPGADAAYLRFAKRVARRPDQVARYYERGGSGQQAACGVVWPAEGGPPPAPPCPLCGGPRSLELQLVAPLAAMFDEAAAWERGGEAGEGGGGGKGGAPGAWRWATVGAWACGRAACGRVGAGGGGDGRGWVAREAVSIVNED